MSANFSYFSSHSWSACTCYNGKRNFTCFSLWLDICCCLYNYFMVKFVSLAFLLKRETDKNCNALWTEFLLCVCARVCVKHEQKWINSIKIDGLKWKQKRKKTSASMVSEVADCRRTHLINVCCANTHSDERTVASSIIICFPTAKILIEMCFFFLLLALMRTCECHMTMSQVVF